MSELSTGTTGFPAACADKYLRLQGRLPVLIHIVAVNCQGYAPAEGSADKNRSVPRFELVASIQVKPKTNVPSSAKKLANSIIAEA